MSRLYIDNFLILWSLKGSLHFCETDCAIFCPQTRKVLRGNNYNAPLTAPEDPYVFNYVYLFVCS